MTHSFPLSPFVRAVLLAAASVAAPAMAADTAQLPAIRVTAEDAATDDGRLHAIGAVPAPATLDHAVTQSVSVVDRQDIDRLSPISTLELLSRIPNATINHTGGIAGTVFLRGMNTNDMRVPVFIDGNRFRGRNTLQFMLISPTELEQVEVVRGPDSARFGSDGLGGLINFVTKRAHGNLDHAFQPNGGEVSASWRSNANALQANAALEAAGDGFDLRMYATGRRADNFSSAAGEVPNSGFRGTGGGIVLGYMPDARQRFEISGRFAHVNDDGAGAVPPYPLTSSHRDPLAVKQGKLGYSGEFDGVISELRASLYVNEFDTTLASHNQVNAARVVDTRRHVIGPLAYGGNLAATIPWASVATTVGMDFMHEIWPGQKMRSQTTLRRPDGTTTVKRDDWVRTGPIRYQTNIGVFLSNEWNPAPKWTVSAGGRFDWYRSDVGLSPLPSPDLLPAFRTAQNNQQTATTGSLGVSYRATEVVELLGSVGNSFRMPWVFDMFNAGFTGTSYSFPNPQLKPERGTNADIGARLHFDDATVGLTAFRSNFRDFIESVDTVYMGLPATQRRNVGRTRVQGLESDWRWQVARALNVYGSASYLHATNLVTKRPLPSIAALSGLMGVQYVGPNEAYALSGELQWAKGQNRYDDRKEYPAGGFGVVNLYAQLQLDKLGLPRVGNTQAVLGISNLFNRAYRSAATASNVNYPMTDQNPLLQPGRSFNLTLRTRF
ncbi:TonB-dependent receptor [Achromobacter xylosoxidans]|uniref:TonB-dependent receptor n=1 Tax=Alcaligenes xylosoxydans xylosoxydans TaxID=85698 RepID=UPI0006C32C54|nr:TonB-dependent receptor [Achromobacter xylosoxidans]QQE59622.1 TonB-dependent receptor [Achromobacter xylosoxidans]QQV13366.1 TonB-dependent receptor [Achromobacter xylosoxidans]UXL03414.1 TonB-dependent receptor [Achromobacter xylosoxidans]CUJ25019.1 Outer membrane cobalamin translocator [Achromobacter xylosoxidans]